MVPLKDSSPIERAIQSVFVRNNCQELRSDTLYSLVRFILNDKTLPWGAIVNSAKTLGLVYTATGKTGTWNASFEQIDAFKTELSQEDAELAKSQVGTPVKEEKIPEGETSPEDAESPELAAGTDAEKEGSGIALVAETLAFLNKQLVHAEEERRQREDQERLRLEEEARLFKEHQKKNEAQKSLVLEQLVAMTKQLGDSAESEPPSPTAMHDEIPQEDAGPAQAVVLPGNEPSLPNAQLAHEPLVVQTGQEAYREVKFVEGESLAAHVGEADELQRKETELEEAKSLLADKEAELSKKQEELEHERMDAKFANASLWDALAELEAAKSEKEALSAKLEGLDSDRLRSELAAEIENAFEARLQDKERRIRELEDNVAQSFDSGRKISDLQTQLEDKNGEIRDLTNTVNELKNQIAALSGQIAELTVKHESPAQGESLDYSADVLEPQDDGDETPMAATGRGFMRKLIMVVMFLAVMGTAFIYFDPFEMFVEAPAPTMTIGKKKQPAQAVAQATSDAAVSLPAAKAVVQQDNTPIAAARKNTTSSVATAVAVPDLSPDLSSGSGEYLVVSSSRLRELTEKSAALESLKLELEIAEMEAKLGKLREAKEVPVAPVPVIIGTPVAVPGQSAPFKADISPDRPARNNRLIAVQGIDGKLVAVVETNQGIRTLGTGGAYNGGTIEKITSDGVHVKVAGQKKPRFYSVEE
jgi:hypothetical protein